MITRVSHEKLGNIFKKYIENLAIPCVGKSVEQWEFSYLTGLCILFYNHFGKLFGIIC